MKVQDALERLTRKKPGVPIRATALVEGPDLLGYFWVYLALFGFWTVTQKKEINPAYKRFFSPEMVTPHPLGITLASLLLGERDFARWNLPFRRQFGERKVLPGQSLPENDLMFHGSAKSRKLRIVRKDQSGEPFFIPFIPLFAEGSFPVPCLVKRPNRLRAFTSSECPSPRAFGGRSSCPQTTHFSIFTTLFNMLFNLTTIIFTPFLWTAPPGRTKNSLLLLIMKVRTSTK